MAKKKTDRGLGRGLSALMSDVSTDDVIDDIIELGAAEELVTPKGVTVLSIDSLERNPDQPRRYFDPVRLAELTQSIKDKGVLQPVLVRPLAAAESLQKAKYQIVAGERRWQAALKAGLDSLPVLIRELSDRDVLEIGVVENVQRADLNPIEEALAYKALVDQFSRTQDEIAKAIGKSRSHISNMMRLLSLPEQAQLLLQEGKLSMGHARAIIAAPDPAGLAETISVKNLSVREAEDLVRKLKRGHEGARQPSGPKDADIRKVEQELINALGLAIDLKHRHPGGELRIKYKTGDQLQELIRRLKD